MISYACVSLRETWFISKKAWEILFKLRKILKGKTGKKILHMFCINETTHSLVVNVYKDSDYKLYSVKQVTGTNCGIA